MIDQGARRELARGRADNPLIKIEDVAAITFEKPDLDRTERYLTDFGLLRAARTADILYMRGYGTAHHCYVAQRGAESRFLGFTMRAACAADLERLASLPEASPVETIEAPGGGRRVRLQAPNGIAVDVVFDTENVAPLPMRAPLAMNNAYDKVRLNAAQRPLLAAAEVTRLGHVVMQTRHHSRMLLWLMRTLGMIVSDYQILESHPEAGPILAFIRCDRGTTPTDHHTIALAVGFVDGFEHAAFEVQDLDAVAMGGEHLKRQGWTRAWGVGRHILGSQIFDYWRDPEGALLEHFADGDLFDARVPTGTSPFSRSHLAQWGPHLPPDFIDASMSPRKLLQLVSALRSSEDLSVRKLLAMKKALSQ